MFPILPSKNANIRSIGDSAATTCCLMKYIAASEVYVCCTEQKWIFIRLISCSYFIITIDKSHRTLPAVVILLSCCVAVLRVLKFCSFYSKT